MSVYAASAEEGSPIMTKFLVHSHNVNKLVLISLDGFGPTAKDNATEIGSFELDVDPNDHQMLEALNVNGEHIFIHEARKVLQDYLGEGINISKYRFEDHATNSVQDANEHADYSTDALRTTDGGGDPDTSTQAGGIQNTDTKEIHPAEQEEGNETETPPATDAVTSPESTGNGTETGSDESSSSSEDNGSETVAQLKERIAKITDKAELEAIYKAEQEGKNRPTALKAIEDRATELHA